MRPNNIIKSLEKDKSLVIPSKQQLFNYLKQLKTKMHGSSNLHLGQLQI